MEKLPHSKPELDEREKRLEHIREKLIQNMRQLLYEWSDERLAGDVYEGPYKVRLNWWTCVIGYMKLAMECAFIRDPILLENCQEFYLKYAGGRARNDDSIRIESDDIEYANRLLENVINELNGVNK